MRYWLVPATCPTRSRRSESATSWGRVSRTAISATHEWKVLLEYEGRQHAERRPVRPGHRPLLAHGRRRLAGSAVREHGTSNGPTVLVDRTREH